jgi:hypothetical protein
MTKKAKQLDIQAIINRTVQPEHTVLPAKYDSEGNLVRSYPGAPDVIGWTVFTRKPDAYNHTGDPVYATEREALDFLKSWRGITIRLNWNPSGPRGGQ